MKKKKSLKKRLLRAVELIVTLGMADWIKDISGDYRRSVIDRQCAEYEQKSFLDEVHMAAAGDPCCLRDWPREYRQFCNCDIDHHAPVYVVAGCALHCCNLPDGAYMQSAGPDYVPYNFVLIRPDEPLYRNIPEFEDDTPVYEYIVRRLIRVTDAGKTAQEIYADWKEEQPNKTMPEEYPNEYRDANGNLDELCFESCLSLMLERNQKRLDALLNAYCETYPEEQAVVVSEYFPDGNQRYCVCRPQDVVCQVKRL